MIYGNTQSLFYELFYELILNPKLELHITDYSSTRQELLKRDIRVSDSKQQIMDMCQEMIDNNVKKGWKEV